MSIDQSVFLANEDITVKDFDILVKDDLENVAKYLNLDVPSGIKKIPLKQMIISHLVKEGFLEDEGLEAKN